MKSLLLTFSLFLAKANASCDSYSLQLIAPEKGYATPFWWHGHEYPTFHVGPCTVLNFGTIQTNQNIVFTSKIGYENCGGEPDRKALLPSEDAVVGLYGIGDHIYKVEDVTSDVDLYFIDTLFKHCDLEDAKVAIKVLADAEPWNAQIGSSQDDLVRGLARDKVTGHVIIIGDTMGGVDEKKNEGRSVGEQDGWIAAVDGMTGEVSWKVQEGSEKYERFLAVAIDPTDSSIWVLGETIGGIFSTSSPSTSFQDVFLARYDSLGKKISGTTMSGPGQTFAVGLDFTEGGDCVVLVAYSESDHRYLGDASAYGGDMVMRLYRLDGQMVKDESIGASLEEGGCEADKGCSWMREFTTEEALAHSHQDSDAGEGDGRPWRDVTPTGVSVAKTRDGEEVIYVVGKTSGSSPDLGGDHGGGDNTSNDFDGFLTKIRALDGGVMASARISGGSGSNDVASDVCVSDSGDPVVVGSTTGSLSVGSSEGGNSMFSRMYHGETMQPVWTVQGEGEGYGTSCAGGAGGGESVYVLGRVTGGEGGLGGWDARLMQVESNAGTVRWDVRFGTVEDDMIGFTSGSLLSGGVVVDSVGGAVVGGVTRGGWGDKRMGNQDAFLARFNPRGEHAKAYGSGTKGEGVEVGEGGGGGGGGGASIAGVVVAALVMVVGCAVGFVWGRKRTEAKYSKLRDGAWGDIEMKKEEEGAEIMDL
ncbi:hypothetical protein TrCOL_g1042 [Triparma columacea]|uniref:Uncharacterized protein n=1 Tax=Triparma columacea TaxID=722753 RepID=A0A9W7G0S0_9STRA|nr:hypothetical protein TrCOL_g1042 [Triparma columacea]